MSGAIYLLLNTPSWSGAEQLQKSTGTTLPLPCRRSLLIKDLQPVLLPISIRTTLPPRDWNVT
jgi:hypothetical protein